MESFMSEQDGKPKVTKFKKRPHRPWKTSLLETTVNEADGIESEAEEVEFSLDTSDAATTTSDSIFSDFSFNIAQEETSLPELSPSLQSTFSQLAAIAIDNDSHTDLKAAIKTSEEKKSELIQQITDKGKSPVSLGGFFRPQQLTTSEDTQSTRKMNFLLSDLKNKEQELKTLTDNLKVTEAIERCEQAELNRRAEEQRRIAAENRMRQAIEQAHSAAEQCRLAMEQANQAAIAHREEEQLRKLAEDQVNDYKIRLNTAELALHNERNAKIAADQIAQQALRQTEEANATAKRQIDEAHVKVAELTQHNEELKRQILELEANFKDANSSLIYTKQKLEELTAQRDKLKSIIEAEQELRRVAERSAEEATKRAEQAEKACEFEAEQRKITDARAKRAMEHASRTVMHLLNAPVDNEYNMRVPQDGQPVEKLKIKVPAETTKKEYIPSDDDYSF
jgi:chromosome segregation ATPase